jgi:hypothetical protein
MLGTAKARLQNNAGLIPRERFNNGPRIVSSKYLCNHLTIACELSMDIYANHGGSSIGAAPHSSCGPQLAVAAAFANDYDEGTTIVLARRVFPDGLDQEGYVGQQAVFAQRPANWR